MMDEAAKEKRMSSETWSSDGKLVVCEQAHGKFYIMWYFPEDDEFGAALDKCGVVAATDDREHRMACKAVHHMADGTDDVGYYWESKRLASAALKAAKAAIAEGAPAMPWWAMKALSEGWKAPKGWKP